jgi:hypothetical protein
LIGSRTARDDDCASMYTRLTSVWLEFAYHEIRDKLNCQHCLVDDLQLHTGIHTLDVPGE